MYKIIYHPLGLKFVEFYNSNDFHVILSNYGASIYQIDQKDYRGNLETITLTPLMNDYYKNPKYMGLTVGRVAGRIDSGLFTINNMQYNIYPNSNGVLLHSGFNTLAYKTFDYVIDDFDNRTIVKYSINVKDMEDGFPGNLSLNVIYTLYKNEDKIDLEYQAISDKDTLLSLTNHSYFNLSGNLKSDILNHELTINKDSIGEFNYNSILSNKTDITKEFDFREGKLIGEDIESDIVQKITQGYDHYFIGKDETYINLYDPISKRNLEIETNYHDVLFYTNNYVSNEVFANEVIDKKYLAVAIEPNDFSNVLTNKGLILQRNKLYSKKISYSFTIKEI